MRRRLWLSVSTILICLAACQPSADAVLPTLAVLPTVAPPTLPPPTSDAPEVMLEATPRTLVAIAPPRNTPALLLLETASPMLSPITPSTLAPTATPAQWLAPAFAPDATLPADGALLAAVEGFSAAADAVQIGLSAGGRPIAARLFGSGERTLLLVGAMHGGWEANTSALVLALAAHFEAAPGDIPPGVRVVLVAAANPDGLVFGRAPAGRFNGHGVDLNRNWGCDWSSEAVWRNHPVDPGSRAMSEPETAALAAFMAQLRPAAALFYHSAAGGVFEGECGADQRSLEMSALYGAAAGYSYGQPFSAYPVTGTAANWASGQGIAAADVELATSDDAEFTRNLAGVQVLLAWLAAR